MSESSLPLTDGDGSGGLRVNTQTIGGTAVDTQAVFVGQTPNKTYTMRFQDTSMATANAHLAVIMGNGTAYPKIHEIHIAQGGTATGTAVAEIQVLRVTTAGTGGTAVSARPFHPSNTSPYSGSCFVLPSAAGSEGDILLNDSMNLRTANTGQVVPMHWTQTNFAEPIISGNGTASGIAIKNLRAVVGGTAVGYIIFSIPDWQ